MITVIANNLSLGYDGKSVVSDLNFQLNCGEFLSIIGENGSGKSTLVKAMLGFNKPLFGELLIKKESGEKQKIGYLSQKIDARDGFPASVKEIVLSGCLVGGKWRPFYTNEQKLLCKEKMEIVGVSEYQNRLFGELSGGQKQRVLLARALCSAKDAIILDEPVAGLDPQVATEMYQAVNNLRNSGITVIMVSHDVHSAMKYSDKILHIGHGKNFFGTPSEYAEIEKHCLLHG